MKISLKQILKSLSNINNINYIDFKNGITIGSKEYNCFEYITLYNGYLHYCLIDYSEEEIYT